MNIIFKYFILSSLLVLINNPQVFSLGKVDDIARLGKGTSKVGRIPGIAIPKYSLFHVDDATRIGFIHADDFSRLAVFHMNDVARIGLKQGDDIIHNFSDIHKRVHIPNTLFSNVDNVAYTGIPNDMFRKTKFVTDTGNILDGNILYNDIINYSYKQFGDIVAAVKGQPLKNSVRQINGIDLAGDELITGLINRHNRINDFVSLGKLGKNENLLQGIHGTHNEISNFYNISLSGRETPEQIAEIIGRTGRTNNSDLMTSTIIKGSENSAVRAENYALFVNNVVPKNNLHITRELSGTAETKGFNISNQCLSYAREPGYFLMPKGLKTEVIKTVPYRVERDGQSFQIIRVIERIIE